MLHRDGSGFHVRVRFIDAARRKFKGRTHRLLSYRNEGGFMNKANDGAPGEKAVEGSSRLSPVELLALVTAGFGRAEEHVGTS
jgi:hypothetical protein